PRHRRSGAVVLFGAPVARADLDALLRPDRFASVILADRLTLLRHRAVAGDRNFLNMLFIHRPAGGPADRDLVFLPDWLAHRVAALADVLFVHRLANRVLLGDVIGLPDRLAHGVTALAEVLLVNGPASRGAALLHDGVIDRAIADARLF